MRGKRQKLKNESQHATRARGIEQRATAESLDVSERLVIESPPCEDIHGLELVENCKFYPDSLGKLPSPEVEVLEICVDSIRELTFEDKKNVEILKKLWRNVFRWYAKEDISIEALPFLESFMNRLLELLSEEDVSAALLEHIDELIGSYPPTLLIDLCQNETFAQKVSIWMVQKLWSGLNHLEKEEKEPGEYPLNSEEKRICVDLAFKTCGIIEAVKLKQQTLRSLKDIMNSIEVEKFGLTIAFFVERITQYVESAFEETTKPTQNSESKSSSLSSLSC